jgi:hypothetical protein
MIYLICLQYSASRRRNLAIPDRKALLLPTLEETGFGEAIAAIGCGPFMKTIKFYEDSNAPKPS